MAKVTISAYDDLPTDVNGRELPIAAHSPLYSASFGTTAQTPALPDETRFVRVATDTAIQIKRNGAGASATDDMIPANGIEFFGAYEGGIISWLPA